MKLSNEEISTGIFHIKQSILSNYKLLKDIKDLNILETESGIKKEVAHLNKVVEFLQNQQTI